MTENTKETPGPFDAFSTAKPGEPIFTLQGGDPVAVGLVTLWAQLARVRAGALSMEFVDSLKFGEVPAAETEAEKVELLLRASSAEEVVWAMHAYRTGQALDSNEGEAYEQSRRVERPHTAEDDDALNKLLRHREQVRLARMIHNSIAEVNEVMETLKADRSIQPAVADIDLHNLNFALINLRAAVSQIEPHRTLPQTS